MTNTLQRLMAVTAHVSYLLFGIGFLFVPAAIYLWYSDKDEFIAQHALQALKIQGGLVLGAVVLFVATFLTFGIFSIFFLLYFAIVAAWIPFSLWAAYKAIIGESYCYPFLE